MKTLDKDISVEPPKDTYIHFALRSGLPHEYQIHALTGVIDENYPDPLSYSFTILENIPL